jgi:hypothetical protein
MNCWTYTDPEEPGPAGTSVGTEPMLVLVNTLVNRWPSFEDVTVPVVIAVVGTSEEMNPASPVLTALIRCDVNGFSTTLSSTVSYHRRPYTRRLAYLDVTMLVNALGRPSRPGALPTTATGICVMIASEAVVVGLADPTANLRVGVSGNPQAEREKEGRTRWSPRPCS